MIRYHVIYVIFFVLTATMVLNEIHKSESHHEFAEKVDSFMQAGGRNTALHGYQLCIDINHLKAEYYHHHERPFEAKSCAEIYGLSKEEVDQINLQKITHWDNHGN